MKPFTTDGCSGGLWKLLTGDVGPWNGCCVDHDKLYWPGGTRLERLKADAALMACVANNGHPWIAIAMFIGVRVGGHPLLPTPWRWGYGHRWPRGYTSEVRQTPLAGASPIRRSWLYLAILIVVLIVATAAIWLAGAAHAHDTHAVCFDREFVFDAARRLGMAARWSGFETSLDPIASAHAVPENTLVLFLKPDGAGWSLWTFKDGEGCRVAKGVDWQRLDERPLLRGVP